MPAREQLAGVVVSAGKMMKTVKVRMFKQTWNRRIGKNFTVPYNVLVHDANDSVVEGDVITLRPEQHARHVHHTIEAIIAPFGKPLDERPPLVTAEEREALVREYKARKAERRQARELEAQALAGAGVQQVKYIDAGGEGQGKGPGGAGREVLEDGTHRFGKINAEAILGKNRAMRRMRQARQNEKDLEAAEDRSELDVQKQTLKQ